MKVVAVLLFVLIASVSSQTSSSFDTCMTAVSQFQQDVIQQKQLTFEVIMKGIAQIKELGTACSALLHELGIGKKQNSMSLEKSDQLGISLNCTNALKSAVATIVKIKGSFTGGLNKDIIMKDLTSIGVSTMTVIRACA